MIRESAPQVVWRHRWLLLALYRREMTARYLGSVGGLAWALLQPAMLLAVYALVFQVVFKVKFPALEQYPFILFLATALWPWMAFQESVVRGTQAVMQNGPLVKKVAFPHELLVYAAVAAAFSLHMIGYALVLAVLSLWGYTLQWAALPWVLLWCAVLALAALGLALMLATVQVFLRDVEQALGQVLMVLFYLTPILYPLSLLPSDFQKWVMLNPLAHWMDAVRNAWLMGAEPSFTLVWMSAGSVVMLFWGARRMFMRLSPYFEDMV